MELNIILAGVGGQGILTTAQALSLAALRRGWQIKQAEVHGMSQRGGAVQSRDGAPGLVFTVISLRGHHHAHGGVGQPTDFNLIKPVIQHSLEHLVHVGGAGRPATPGLRRVRDVRGCVG